MIIFASAYFCRLPSDIIQTHQLVFTRRLRPKELQEQFADGGFCITIGEPSKPCDTNKVKIRM
jgi:hypothetical protein